MSYRFPRRIPRSGEVIDAVDMTESLQYAANESSGRLNQHNFANDAFSSRLHVNDNAFARFDTIQHEADGTDPFVSPAPANAAVITKPATWQPVGGDSGAGRLRYSWVSTAYSALWVQASFQYSGPGELTTFPPVPGINDAGVNFVLSFDGQIIPESATGIMDQSANLFETFGPITFGAHGQYPAGFAKAVVLDAVLAMTPGPHSIELLASTQWSDNATAANWIRYVYNRELILIEFCKAREI